MRIFTAFLLALLVCSQLYAQTESYNSKNRIKEYHQAINAAQFDAELFSDALYYFINQELDRLGHRKLEPAQELARAAQVYADYIAETEESKTGLGGKKQALAYRLSESNGAASGTAEFAAKFSIKKGKEQLYYDSVALAAVYKWFNSKQIDDLTKEHLIKIGAGAKPNEPGKKVYIDVILGNYNSINTNPILVEQHPELASSDDYKLTAYDDKICRKTDRYKNLQLLQKDIIYDKDSRIIYLASDKFKNFSKIMREPTDGIAVDIVSKSLYPCGEDNIVDYRLPSRGIMNKPVYQKKFEKLNEITGKEARYNCKIPLGTLTEGVDEYELNLVVIQQKHACAYLKPSHSVSGEIESQIKLEIMADTITAFNRFSTHYTPQPDTTVLEFRIPFELGKSEYKPEDIQPFIDALNEPDFIVNNLKITAYSSIEGEEGTNEKLREERAQNIFKAFQSMNPGLQEADILTSDSWSIFKTDIQNTEFDTLAGMDRQTAIQYIKANHIAEKLESTLKNHRFADIKMQVIYDISGVKERAFVAKKFQDALENSDLPQALAIEKYIMNKIVRRKYPPASVYDMQIPEDSVRFCGMEMNRLWLEYYIENKPIDTSLYNDLKRMVEQVPDNDYIKFNYAYCRVLFDTITEEFQIDDIQRDIDALYTSSLSKEKIDPLNMKYQLTILNSINESFEPDDEKKLVLQILDKLKEIIDIDDSNRDQALNLSYLFIDMNDFIYASNILEPFILNSAANEELCFTYLAVCSNLPHKHHTQAFAKAVKAAVAWNPERLCALFNDNKFSITILQNPHIKSAYCEQCQQ